MAISSPPAVGTPSIDAIVSRNATQVNLAIQIPGTSGWTRVGRVQSMSEDISNNVQVLMELGSQFAVELKKGISTYTFSIAKFYVHTDVFDKLVNGMIFGLQIQDSSSSALSGVGAAQSAPAASASTLEYFSSCSINTVSRSFQQGQATVAQNASVVAIGQSYGAPD